MTRQLLLMLCAGAAGCAALQSSAPPAPPLGELTRAAFAQQVLEPEASRRREGRAAAGQDGATAALAQRRYQKSFAEPAPQGSAFAIGQTERK